MESEKRPLLLFVALGVGVLSVLLALVLIRIHPPNQKMTIACAHKCEQTARSFEDRDVLPTNVRPMHYQFTITPDMNKFVFEGHVAIK